MSSKGEENFGLVGQEEGNNSLKLSVLGIESFLGVVLVCGHVWLIWSLRSMTTVLQTACQTPPSQMVPESASVRTQVPAPESRSLEFSDLVQPDTNDELLHWRFRVRPSLGTPS